MKGRGRDAVVEEPGRRAQLAELLRVGVGAGVAGDDDEGGRQRLVEAEDGLTAQVARRGGHDVAEDPDGVADAGSAEGEQAADDALQRVQAEVEARRDAEVPPASAERPEELGVLVRARMNHGPGGRDELGADEVVAREAVLRGQVPDAAAQGEAADARRPHNASRSDEPVRLRCRVEVEPGRAAIGVRDPRVRVDLDRLHLREVDHETVVEHAVAGRVVATSTDSDLKLIRAREGEGSLDVGGAETAGDHRRTAVDERVEAAPRGVVAGVLRKDDLACQRLLQLVDIHVVCKTPAALVFAGLGSAGD